MTRSVLYWRRMDVQGLERLELDVAPDGVTAVSTVLCLEDGGFRLDHRWRLDSEWRALSLDVQRWDRDGQRRLLLERTKRGWRLDGEAQPDLEGAEEPDLSVTPFCNTFPIRRTNQSLTLDTAFVDAAAMTVVRSRQRYERQGADRLRYVDLGVSQGFEADLLVDERGLVLRYQHLFERVSP